MDIMEAHTGNPVTVVNKNQNTINKHTTLNESTGRMLQDTGLGMLGGLTWWPMHKLTVYSFHLTNNSLIQIL